MEEKRGKARREREQHSSYRGNRKSARVGDGKGIRGVGLAAKESNKEQKSGERERGV